MYPRIRFAYHKTSRNTSLDMFCLPVRPGKTYPGIECRDARVTKVEKLVEIRLRLPTCQMAAESCCPIDAIVQILTLDKVLAR